MLVTSSPINPLLTPSLGTAAGEKGSTADRAASAKTPLRAAPAAVTDVQAPTPADTVSLSASSANSTTPAYDLPLPVYAEIWKNGLKVAEIDSHGSVVSLTGMVAVPRGGGSGGPAMAAIRAVQVAQSIGGEIRVGGLAVDASTLKMRSRLEAMYGR